MVEHLRAKLLKALIANFGDDDRRIQHALEVTHWAERIMESEGGDGDVVLTVGLLHDVGIKEAEARHSSSSGKLQEQYGPPIVREILEPMGLPFDFISECCAIVGAHHTPLGVPSPNFSVLWDADMIVNLRDELVGVDPARIEPIIEKSFKTSTGKLLARKVLL
jgi:hypothetical protein